MEKVKKNILLQQVQKIDEVLAALKQNFDINEDIADEYSYLSIVRGNLASMINGNYPNVTQQQLDIIGKNIKIVEMVDEPKYNGKTGVAERVDSQGQIFGSWGGLAIQPDRDKFEVID